VRVVFSNRLVHDAVRAGRLEAEATVVAGVAEDEDERPSLLVGASDQFLNECTADALVVMLGGHTERSHSHAVVAAEVPPGRESVADHPSADHSHELEPLDRGARAPRTLDDVDLFLAVVPLARERSSDERENRWPVSGTS